MSETMNEAGRREDPPPWIRPAIQQQIAWRDDDIVISVPAKSGTTWTMNIVHQMLSGGSPDFADVYAEVPWIEFVAHPDQSVQEVLERVAAMPADRPRAFKTHSAPPDLPYFAPDSGKAIKYIVVCRNPEESLVSFRPFLDQHTDAWFDLWQVQKQAVTRPRFPEFYWEIIDPKGMQGMFFGFLASWWPLRHQANVLFMHFSDMKRDHEGSLRKIADFLEIEPSRAQWQSIVEFTSFDWMKRNREKFDAVSVSQVPILETGAMVRRGRAGEARADGMTDEIATHLREVGGRICPDRAAVKWYYEGGEVPR